MTTQRSSGPGVHFPPPLLFVSGIIAAWLLESPVYRLPVFPGTVSPIVHKAGGYLLLLAGVVIAAWGLITFARAHTAIIPNRPASTLVVTGPYSFTRNPMYTGMTLSYLGVAVRLNSGWALVLLPFVLFLLHRLVIRKEERYLSEAFGETYEAYRARVKRWV